MNKNRDMYIDMELISEKQFPENYSTAVLNVLDAMTMGSTMKMRVIGSSSLRSQLYAGDYDIEENVNYTSASAVANSLQRIVKQIRDLPSATITDIKCGEIKEWNVFQPTARVENGVILDFNIVESKAKVDALREHRVLTEKEAKEANELLDEAKTPWGFLNAKKNIRYHILRWLPNEVLEGVKTYRTLTITLETAIETGGMIKIDVVADIRDRFTEFGVVYTLYKNGKQMYPNPIPLKTSLVEDLMYYEKSNPFKALKRFFSLARLSKRYDVIKKISPILNSDLGRLYQIIGDLKTIANLLDQRPFPAQRLMDIRAQIDDMRERLGNIYMLRDFLKKEHTLIGTLYSLLKTPTSQLEGKLDVFIEALEKILDENTRRIVGHLNYRKYV